MRYLKTSTHPRATDLTIAPSPGSPLLRRALILVGALYVAAVFCEGAGASLQRAVFRPVLFFCQIAALFPHAATNVIEYRAEGYTCSGRVVEIDVRPFFPLHADDKENRFERAMFFYRQHRPTMQALEAYLMQEYNRDAADKIGGVILLSLRNPLPAPGSSFARYERTPLLDHPKEQQKVWYVTPHETVVGRCKTRAP